MKSLKFGSYDRQWAVSMIYGHGAVEDHKGGDKSDHNQEGWW